LLLHGKGYFYIMNIHEIYIVLLLLFTNGKIISQTNTLEQSRNVLFIEGLGIGGYGSFNYERLLPLREKFNVGIRIGVSTYHINDFTGEFNPDIIIPLAVSGLYGNNHKLEFGFGNTIANIVQADFSNGEPERISNLNANFTLGYRYQRNNGGVVFRCGYTPIIEFYKDYRHWGGISIGFAF